MARLFWPLLGPGQDWKQGRERLEDPHSPDKFRIRITDDNNSNAVVFDNRINGDASPNNLETADPPAISDGSIVIQ